MHIPPLTVTNTPLGILYKYDHARTKHCYDISVIDNNNDNINDYYYYYHYCNDFYSQYYPTTMTTTTTTTTTDVTQEL